MTYDAKTHTIRMNLSEGHDWAAGLNDIRTVMPENEIDEQVVENGDNYFDKIEIVEAPGEHVGEEYVTNEARQAQQELKVLLKQYCALLGEIDSVYHNAFGCR